MRVAIASAGGVGRSIARADVMFGTSMAMAIAAVVLVIFVTAWFAVPLWRKLDDGNAD